MSSKPNPLLASNATFSLSDSFGPQPALILPNANPLPPPTASSKESSPVITRNSSSSSLGPPQQGVFLLPTSSSGVASNPLMGPPSTSLGPTRPPGPPTGAMGATNDYSLGSAKMTSRYVPPPGIGTSAPPTMSANFVSSPPPTLPTSSTSPSSFFQPPPPAECNISESSPFLPQTSSTILPDGPMGQTSVSDVSHHWFYRNKTIEDSSQQQSQQTKREIWKPFKMVDSTAIENAFLTNSDSVNLVATDGGRYDVCITDRVKTAVYWNEEPLPIRRCSWFYKSNSGMPIDLTFDVDTQLNHLHR